MLIAVPLVTAKQPSEGCVELIRVDLLVYRDNFLEHVADMLGYFLFGRHIHLGCLEGIIFFQWKSVQAFPHLLALERRKHEDSLAFLTRTSCASEAMYV